MMTHDEDAKQRYEADMEDLDESKSVESVVNESVEPLCAAMNRSSPESVFIVKASKIDVSNLGFDYITELQPILPGKKTLIMNNDEDIFPVVENTTQEEFEKALTAEFEENKKAGTYVDDSEAFPFFSYDPEDFGSAKEFVDYVNDFIANSEVDNDSSSQYRWYTSEDVLSLDELKDEWGFDEDDIINESVEPFCEDYDYFNADDFEKEEIYGADVDPNSDEYKAHEEIVNKIFKPKHIEELDWSVVTSSDDDGYVYKEIVHFLDRDDWDKLQSVEDSRAYKKLTPNIGDYELLVSYHLDRGIDEFLDPAISFYAKSLGELSYGDDEEDETEDDSLNESVEPSLNEEEESTKSAYKDTDHIDAGSFAAMLDDVGDAGEHFGPSDDEYQAHQEVIDKIFNPNNIEELGWSVVPTTDDDGRDYMTVTHFLKEADWNKLYDLYSDYQSSESLKKKLKKKFGDYRFEIFFFLDWGTPIFDYPAISFFRAKD